MIPTTPCSSCTRARSRVTAAVATASQTWTFLALFRVIASHLLSGTARAHPRAGETCGHGGLTDRASNASGRQHRGKGSARRVAGSRHRPVLLEAPRLCRGRSHSGLATAPSRSGAKRSITALTVISARREEGGPARARTSAAELQHVFGTDSRRRPVPAVASRTAQRRLLTMFPQVRGRF